LTKQASAPSGTCSGSRRKAERSPSMPYVTIDVLQEDIDRALHDRRLRSRPATFCPVARAACRALDLALGNVQVSGDVISIWGWKDDDYLRVATTHTLERAVTTFDREKTMQPNRFRIHLKPNPLIPHRPRSRPLSPQSPRAHPRGLFIHRLHNASSPTLPLVNGCRRAACS
jgi:hypothetical protein